MLKQSLLNIGDVYQAQTPSESKLFIESLMNIYTG